MSEILPFNKLPYQVFDGIFTSHNFEEPTAFEASQNLFSRFEKFLEKPTLRDVDYFRAYTRVGGDPEFFISSPNNTLIPSFDWFGTDPESHDNFTIVALNNSKVPVIFSPKKYSVLQSLNGEHLTHWYVHPDGVQLECGYNPVNCMESTSIYISQMFMGIKNALATDKFSLNTATSQTISPELAFSAPLGCRPSFNAHDIDNNITDKNPLRRFTGGHFHFSVLSQMKQHMFYSPKLETHVEADPNDIEVFNNTFSLININEEARRNHFNNIIKLMDATIGIWSVAFAGKLDDPDRRYHHYGMAGDYRLTKCTVEYRVPSNVVWQNSVSWHVMGMMGRYIVKNWFLQSEDLPKYLKTVDWGEVTDIINNTDVDRARAYWTKHSDSLQNLFCFDNVLYKQWHKVNALAAESINCINPAQHGWDVIKHISSYPTTLTTAMYV